MREPDQVGRGISGCLHPACTGLPRVWLSPPFLNWWRAVCSAARLQPCVARAVACCWAVAAGLALLEQGWWAGAGQEEWAWRWSWEASSCETGPPGRARCVEGRHIARGRPFLCSLVPVRGSPPRLLLHRGDSGTAGRAGEDNEVH